MDGYTKQAIKTENQDFDGIGERISTKRNSRLLHGGIGLATETGEILDAIKKHVFYGAELDTVNIEEELGDVLWYVAILCDELNLTLDQVCVKNIVKLQKRYPNKFTKDDAVNRDLKAEREILEK
jgi:NTP pyrophosphatase (non-canonical NTP hydrolase)